MEASLEDFQQSDSIGKLMDALAKAQGAMPPPIKNKKNPHFGSMYADHAAVVECSKPHLAANGLAVVQGNGFKEDRVVITTLLGHSSGEWIRTRLSIRPDKPTAQGIGSTVTYGRRYGHCAILNMAPDDDDDGNEATKQADNKPDTYTGLPHQKITLKAIFDGLGVDDGQMAPIAEAAHGVPMHKLRAFVEGKINAGGK